VVADRPNFVATAVIRPNSAAPSLDRARVISAGDDNAARQTAW